MAKKKSKKFAIESDQPEASLKIDAEAAWHTQDDKAGVSMRYYQKKHECLSSWTKREVKAFSNWVEKMCARSEPHITSTTKTCHAHKGETKPLPDEISPDVTVYSLDVTDKARVHGFFAGGQFFLVWLDREHKILSG
ncbi:MAG: hypothetical protein AAF557_13630 [Pseudomonadota bacterium]